MGYILKGLLSFLFTAEEKGIDDVMCMFINKPHAGIELSICLS